GGRRHIMERIAPLGPVYQAGTLSGNPLAMAAGLANLRLIQAEGFYETLQERTERLCAGLQRAADQAGVPMATVRAGAMFGFFFAERAARDYAEAAQADIEAFKRFFHACLQRGVYFAPSAYEAGFVSMAHTDEVIDQTIAVAAEAFAELAA
ncbi:MAG: aminotransferase class III-fold pyridoxal phosphate-dependent enzyme, partial [Xanthomonadales bacterium]|nr:aminotransferase class III-fold pyridoxal phosphate-dependent enzyme [Xanthomonadales bacterium]